MIERILAAANEDARADRTARQASGCPDDVVADGIGDALAYLAETARLVQVGELDQAADVAEMAGDACRLTRRLIREREGVVSGTR